jgi:class 3 adenylate cyclase
MPTWNLDYLNSLQDRFTRILSGLDSRLEDVVQGRTAPPADAIPIGSARSVRAAVLFFDIRAFTHRSASAELQDLKRTLLMLDCVIPMVMHLVYDHGGYVEKNTGDGVMAVIGVDKTDSEAANSALDIATLSFFILSEIVNPTLAQMGIERGDARIGIDLGNVLLARIGVATGSAVHERNFLAAVGPAANIASRLQGMAGTNQIWAGDLIRVGAAPQRQSFFVNVTPPTWPWQYTHYPYPCYSAWHYNAIRTKPVNLHATLPLPPQRTLASLSSLLSTIPPPPKR